MLGASELDTVLPVGSHECGEKGQNHLSRPVGHASLDAAQDTVGFLGCKHTLPAHVELLSHQCPQVLLLSAAFKPLSMILMIFNLNGVDNRSKLTCS